MTAPPTIRAWLRRLRSDQSGAALLELALILPVMVVLFFGGYEATQVIDANMRLGNAAQTMADLISEQSSVNSTTLANFCTGTQLVMTPFAASPLSIAIASVTNNGGTTSVDWSNTTCGSATAIANPATVAASLVTTAGTSVIVVQATYSYTATIALVLPAHFTLSQTAFARPRNVETVASN